MEAMEANGRLQRSNNNNNKCLWPECLVQAAARDLTATLSQEMLVAGVLGASNRKDLTATL